MNEKICNTLFWIIGLTLIFNNTPKTIQMNFWGGLIGHKMIVYPLIIGYIYTAYSHYKYRNILVYFDKFKKFVLLYATITMLSLLVGLYTYPYYNLVFSGPINQIEKLPMVLAYFSSYGITIDPELALGAWMVIRQIKSILLETFWCFGGAYMIFCWYHDNWKTAIKIITKCILIGLIIIFAYSSIEVVYLNGNETAKNLLEVITPYFHSIKNDGTWWPPLLWRGQLRSVFAEPSYLGIYAAFSMPFLWNNIINATKTKYKCLYCIILVLFGFLIFLTKARTAVVLFAGELFLLMLFMIYLQEKFFFKRTLIIIICCLLAFVGANYFINNCMITKNVDSGSDLTVQVDKYFSENFTSLASTNKRSNGARYSIMLADLKIGLDNPVLGVGSNLRNAYIPHYLPGISKNSGEVKGWIKDQKEKGVLRSGFPKLGEYTSRFAETGTVGLLLFLLPPVLLLKKMFLKIKTNNEQLPYIFVMISFCGILISGIGDNINITYCYWILLGIGYAMCLEHSEKNVIS
jgi:hypothetical protein